MNSEILVVGRLPLSKSKVYAEDRADLTRRDLRERPQSWRENINTHQSISYFNKTPREPIPAGGRSKPAESRNIVPDVPTIHLHTTNAEASGATKNRPVPSENPLQNITASSVVHSSQTLSPDYADPKRVPGTDQNIYPRAPIGPEFHERYPQLVDFFKQAVDNHKFLKHHTSKINYELRSCGSSPSNAVASIIIFCAEAIFKHLRALLNSRHIRRQYQPEKLLVPNKFTFGPSKPPLRPLIPAVVPFKVVFWRHSTTPTERRSAMDKVVAQSHSFLTMCGSLVRYGDRASTLGLLVCVDSKLYGLTVDHVFKHQRNDEQPIITAEPGTLPDEDDTESSQGSWPWVDDVIYEDLDNDSLVSDTGSVTSGLSHAEVILDNGLTEHYGTSIHGHKADLEYKIDVSMPYLDWALIEFDDGYFKRPNAFFSGHDLKHPKFLTTVSTGLKTSGVDVFMISGVSGTRKGVMLNSDSYIGGKPGENLCQAWNVILSDSSRVIDGDCGSLIVDQETLEVYGHVVASNPLGEAYVVPLQNTFHQISDALGAKDLSLPSPQLLMANLVNHYSEIGNTGAADEAKLILSSMEVLSSTRNGHDIEDQYHEDVVASLKQKVEQNGELASSASTLELPKPGDRPTSFPHERETSKLPLDSLSLGMKETDLVSSDLEERPDPAFVGSIASNPAGTPDPIFEDSNPRTTSNMKGDMGRGFREEHTLQAVAETSVSSSTISLLEILVDNRESNATEAKSAKLPPGPPGREIFLPLSRNRSELEASKRVTKNGGTSISLNSSQGSEQNEGWKETQPPLNFPLVKPAEQNPPCNTLFVGNLPLDTSEDDLKAIFSKLQGYKRMAFRTKTSPMCFVEFEDIAFAAKALHELYAHPLYNSTKGGIRLSFAKNPLGVRDRQGIDKSLNPFTPLMYRSPSVAYAPSPSSLVYASSTSSYNTPPVSASTVPPVQHRPHPDDGKYHLTPL